MHVEPLGAARGSGGGRVDCRRCRASWAQAINAGIDSEDSWWTRRRQGGVPGVHCDEWQS